MNRKCSESLKNKNQMARSVIQKFVMVLAVFVMMSTTAHAGAFLKDDGVTDLGDSYNASNESRAATADKWNGLNGYTALDDAYTGMYIGTFPGNDKYDPSKNHIALKDLIIDFLKSDIIVTDDSFLGWAKDKPNGSADDSSGISLDIDIDADGSTPYNWSVDNTIDFYSVKGGENFALYYIPDGGASGGTYTTAHIDNKDLSHFSVVKITDTPGTPHVPEPATMLLFGFSLIGLAGVARRQNGRF